MIRICGVLLYVILRLAMQIGFDFGAAVFGFIATPFIRLRQRRMRKRRLKELGIPEEGSMALDLGTRTSTNAMVGGGILAQVYVQVVTLIPGDGALETLLLQPESIAFFAVLLAAVIARFSKTPEQPKVL